MANPTAAMLVIGDEILSGRTRDANMHYLAGELTAAGIDLKEVRAIADDDEAIKSAVRQLSETHDHLFTSGGIGPTHDDITADCVALAMGTSIGVRADALAILQAHYDREGIELNEARQRMARIPDGATLIENPVSAAPGFSLGNVHVMAGVPSIFRAMVESLLPGLATGEPILSESVRVALPEGEIAGRLGQIASEFPELSFGSYPFKNDQGYGANLVVRGFSEAELARAVERLKTTFAGIAE